jgi:inorganic pyrophosphatase
MDDKIIAIPHKEPFLSHIDNIDSLPVHLKNQIEFFLSNYKKLEGKETNVTGWDGIEEAVRLIDKCIEDYKNK